MNPKRHMASQGLAPARATSWLTTFNDMITLLMVFFVLIFSMGTVDKQKFKNFQHQLQSAMGVMYEGHHAPGGIISDRQWYVEDKKHPSEPVTKDYKALADQQGLEAEYTPKGIQFTLNDELLFRTASARVTPKGLELLALISSVIKPMNRSIRIEGHTDDRPIASKRYPSNWELSTARAVNVVKYFVERGIPAKRLSAAGYGASKPRVPNDSDIQRSKNRRVEIILGQDQPQKPEISSFEGE